MFKVYYFEFRAEGSDPLTMNVRAGTKKRQSLRLFVLSHHCVLLARKSSSQMGAAIGKRLFPLLLNHIFFESFVSGDKN